MKSVASLEPWARLVYRPSLRRWRTHPVLAELRRLEEEQWLPADACVARHVSRLDDTVGFALARVPYYRRRLREADMAHVALRLPEDLPALPILSRDELIECKDELLADGEQPAGSVWNHTGGSTGQPVSFLQEDAYRVANLAATARHDRWAGWRFGARTALMWGADRDLAKAQSVRQRLERRWLRRQIEFDAFELDEARLAAFTEQVIRFKPQSLRGYATVLDRFARFLEERGVGLPPLEGIISCAETLTPEARERLERVLGARVFDRYGAREFGPIASQCEEGRYHVNTRGVWVEILDGDRPARPGRVGRVVITGLAARAMPLIRYETGDLATRPEETRCPCSRGLPLLGPIRGRTSDFVITADGRSVHGEYFTHLFYGKHHVERFDVHQDAAGKVTISVVGDGDGLAAEVDQVSAAVREHLGAITPVTFLHVDDLPPRAAGKRCFVRSERGATQWRAGKVRVTGESNR